MAAVRVPVPLPWQLTSYPANPILEVGPHSTKILPLIPESEISIALRAVRRRTKVGSETGNKVSVRITFMSGRFAKSPLLLLAWFSLVNLLAVGSVLACDGEVTSPISERVPITTAPTSTPLEPPTATPASTPTAAPASTSTPTPSPTAPSTPAPRPKGNPTSVTSGFTPTSELVITVSSLPGDIPPYDRDDWRHWTDEDGDCQDARHEVLIEESRAAITYKNDRECQVVTGEWFGVFTGTTVTEAGDLDIDHLVPLKNAHQSGGWAWTPERKEQYANNLEYPGHLIAVTAGANRSKGAKSPDEWRPPNESYWCEYAVAWIAVKQTWELSATPQEAEALEEMLGMCASPPRLTVRPGEAPPAPAEPTSNPTAADTYADCDEAEEAGEQRVQGTNGTGRGFPQSKVPSARDGDGDGIVCEK